MPLSARLVVLALAVFALAAALPSTASAARSFDERFGTTRVTSPSPPTR
jgi:hypothetical protein